MPALSVVICYRPQPEFDRKSQLDQLLHVLDGCLLPGSFVYVVEQCADSRRFNRGQLLNEGIIRSLEEHPQLPVCVHDVDLLPGDDMRSAYTRCAALSMDGGGPYHLAACYERYRGHGYFGGIVLMSPEQWEVTNGFPNTFWGWGGEDDALRTRVLRCGLKYSPVEGSIVDLERDETGSTIDAAKKQATIQCSAAACEDRRARVRADGVHWRHDGITWLRENRPHLLEARDVALRSIRGTHCVLRLSQPPNGDSRAEEPLPDGNPGSRTTTERPGLGTRLANARRGR